MHLSPDIFTLEAGVFEALAHPARLKILTLLQEGEACVCHIQAMLDLRQAYISQHLNVLKQAGLVASRKDGLRVYYQISDPRWFEAIELVEAILQPMREELPDIERSYPATSSKVCHCPQCVAKTESQTIEPEEITYA